MTDKYFTSIDNELRLRIARATVSQMGVASGALRAHLLDVLARPAGAPGSFLGEPVFEALFEWARCAPHETLESIPYLEKDLVRVLDAPMKGNEEYRFPRDRRPYLHQRQTWDWLCGDEPRSALVRTGTASGKTEAFLVPVLNDLVRETRETGQPLVGVRALFLYPLNALINSQRKRLDAFVGPLGGSVRYCLYNGTTPNDSKDDPKHEVRGRRTLRSSPPPVLLTNATMLEYMLVRAEDAPIVTASKGTLRWIVLDEAHSYAGSSAAEVSLLLRRVLDAFEVSPDDVRFVATSATIGGQDRASEEKLEEFLSELAGVSRSRVKVFSGARVPPALPADVASLDAPLPAPEALTNTSSGDAFRLLASSAHFRAVREALVRPLRIDEIARALAGNGSPLPPESTLVTLDIASAATSPKGDHLLPLRGHHFVRTQPGMWACVDAACTEKAGSALAGPDAATWQFGAVHFQRRHRCPCGARVYEMVQCTTCGEAFLSAVITDDERGETLEPTSWSDGEMEGEPDGGDDDDADGAPSRMTQKVLLVPESSVRDKVTTPAIPFDPASGAIDAGHARIAWLAGGRKASGDGSEGVEPIECTRCATKETAAREQFRPARLGAPFYLGVAVPTLLEHVEAMTPSTTPLPGEGRRMLTFSDSRQGTARFALRMQLDSERNWSRAFIYHELQNARRIGGAANEVVMKALEAMPPSPERDAAIAQQRAPGIRWTDMRDMLMRSDVLTRFFKPSMENRYPGETFEPQMLADIVLFREFFRRPRRAASVETLGLARLAFRPIEALTSAPRAWTDRGKSLRDWKDFLTIYVDFVIRALGAIEVDRDVLRWAGARISPTRLVDFKADIPTQKNKVYRRPGFSMKGRIAPRMAKLLVPYLNLRTDDEHPDRATLASLLDEAFHTLTMRQVLVSENDMFRCRLHEIAELHIVEDAWVCPLTRRVLTTTLGGRTPYEAPAIDVPLTQPKCAPIRFLMLPVNPDTPPDGAAKVTEWLASPEIETLRRLGVWTEFSDRIAQMSRTLYLEAGEHSAQQSSGRLRQLERDFDIGRVNVLSCSTTMEMGIDIAGLNAVGMNNAPPSPANYTQRAGRAGRRGANRASVLTLCQATSHASAVFNDTRWPFAASAVPKVSLGSARILQRHVNSLVLARFFRREGQDDAMRMTSSGFFVRPGKDAADATPQETRDSSGVADALVRWLEGEALEDRELAVAIQRLLARSPFEIAPNSNAVVGWLGRAAESMREVRESWSAIYDALLVELIDAGGSLSWFEKKPSADKTTPTSRALYLQIKRWRGEYLLRYLASEGFLPAYGFPLHVLPFVKTTGKDLRLARELRDSDEKPEREDAGGRKWSGPTRELPRALREYVPGASVIVDGGVYTSAGVTLSWRRPQNDQVQEPQAIRRIKRCRQCGAIAEMVNAKAGGKRCAACGNGELVDTSMFLKPSGFAVDIRADVTNDISQVTYVPGEQPWISAALGEWRALISAEAGRLRYDPDGVVFHYSRGTAHKGYALCLHCGRAASEKTFVAEDPARPEEMRDHLRLRGGRDADKEGRAASACPGGAEGATGVLRNLWLGGSYRTDVLEIELRDPRAAAPLLDDQIATTVAAAARLAVARMLEIDPREIGFAIVEATDEAGAACRRVALYDVAEGGAGYVGSVVNELAEVLRRAKQILECQGTTPCDRVCHACLLSFDTDALVDRLDRKRALPFLDAVVALLALPSSLHLLGPTSRVELSSLPGTLADAVRREKASAVRLFVGGPADAWQIESWPMWRHLGAWTADGINVTVALEGGTAASALSWQTANAFQARAAALGATVGISDAPLVTEHGGRLLAEIAGARRVVWATNDEESLCVSREWGQAANGSIVSANEGPSPALRSPRPSLELPRDTPTALTRVVLGREWDGTIDGLGERVWAWLRSVSSPLPALLDGATPLASIRISDKFLRSPLAARTAYEVLRGLTSFPGGIAPSTRVLLEMSSRRIHSDGTPKTKEIKKASQGPDAWCDWVDPSAHEAVVEGIARRIQGDVDVTLSHEAGFQHHREIALSWPSGEIVFALDHGLSVTSRLTPS